MPIDPTGTSKPERTPSSLPWPTRPPPLAPARLCEYQCRRLPLAPMPHLEHLNILRPKTKECHIPAALNTPSLRAQNGAWSQQSRSSRKAAERLGSAAALCAKAAKATSRCHGAMRAGGKAATSRLASPPLAGAPLPQRSDTPSAPTGSAWPPHLLAIAPSPPQLRSTRTTMSRPPPPITPSLNSTRRVSASTPLACIRLAFASPSPPGNLLLVGAQGLRANGLVRLRRGMHKKRQPGPQQVHVSRHK